MQSKSDIPVNGIDNYEDACDANLSRKEAIAEIENHSLSIDEFLDEVGDKSVYSGKEVLDWLGY